MYLNVFGQPVIIFNSLVSAAELLDRRASVYSDRPRVIIAHDIYCGGLFTATMSYGEVFVFTLTLKPRVLLFILFLVGVAIVARLMKPSQRPWFVITTQHIAKRQ
jgi:hypothetical protein